MAIPSIQVRAEELASTLPPLLVAADRVATTVFQGVHGRRRVGQGETFWQFRRYQQGDSAQLIDWRQSAKSQPIYVREHEWEAAQSVWLWRDGSQSMDYRSRDDLPSKSDRASLLTVALASLLVRGGEQIATLGSGIGPRSGRGALMRLVALIEDRQIPGRSLPAAEPLPRHARLVLIGDFLSPLEELKATIDVFVGSGVRGHLLQVLDPTEETLPFNGRVRFEGMEDEGNILIGKVEAVRDAYRGLLADHREGLRTLAQAAGWTFAVHHTDRPPQTALLGLFLALTMDGRR